MRVVLNTFDGQLLLNFHATLSWDRGIPTFVEREFNKIDQEIAKAKANATANQVGTK